MGFPFLPEVTPCCILIPSLENEGDLHSSQCKQDSSKNKEGKESSVCLVGIDGNLNLTVPVDRLYDLARH